MTKLFSAVLTLILATSATFGATITALVIDGESKSPLIGATIVVEATDRTVVTDESGRFSLDNIPDTGISIRVTHVGYRAVHGLAIRVNADNTIRMARTMSVLDNVVVTANRYEKEAYKVTQPITATNSEEIQKKGYTTVSDVVRNFPGIDMNDAGPFRSRPVIRGLSGTRVLVLVDGERLNDQRDISSFAGVSMSLVDVNNIERVEVVNGPSSVLYGSDAMGGVINIITRRNGFSETIKPTARYSGRYSTADQQNSSRLEVGVEGPNYAASLGFQYREAVKDYSAPSGWNSRPDYEVFRPGFYDSLNSATGHRFSRDRLVNSRARVNNYDGRLSYKLNDQHRLDADFGSLRGHNIGYPGVPNAATPIYFYYPAHDRDNVSVTYTGKAISKRLAKLEAKLYYDKISKDFFTDFLGSVKFPAGPGRGEVLTNLNRTEVTKMGLNFQELYAVGPKWNLTFGLDFLNEKIGGKSTTITRFTGFGPAFNDTTVGSSVPENTWNSVGAYSSGELKLDPLLVTVGVRYDNFWLKTKLTPGYVDKDHGVRINTPQGPKDTFNLLPVADEHYSRLNGSLGLAYAIGKVNLVANLGSAYRVPNVVERFYFGSASGRETRPNATIKPEQCVTFDFGVKAVHKDINYSLMGFVSNYKDFMQLQNYDSLFPGHPGPYTKLWRYENYEDVRISGFEFVIEAHPQEGYYFNWSLSYQHGEIRSAKQPLFVSPLKGVFTAGYSYHKLGLFGEVTLKQVGDQKRIPKVAYLDDIATQGYGTISATVGASPWKNIRLALTGSNLTNRVYAEPFNARNPDNPIVEAGRNFILTLSAGI